MRTGYTSHFPQLADPEVPIQTPIPIKIIQEAPPPLPPLTDLFTIPSKKCDDFYPAWLRFTSVEPRRAKFASRSARAVQEKKELLKQSSQSTYKAQHHVFTAWSHAAAECRAKVDAIVEECRRLNKKYRDAMFDLEGQCCLTALDGTWPKSCGSVGAPPWVKRVEDIYKDPVFFDKDTPLVDVHQGPVGDCWFLASLISVSAKKDLFESLCVARDEKVGVYGFVFYRDGEWVYEVIDDKLYIRVGDDDKLDIVRDYDRYERQGISIRHKEDDLKSQLQTGGEALFFSYSKSNETWLPLIEKAFAKAHGDYKSIEGGWAGEGIEDLTGGVSVVINPEDIMDKDRFWKEELMEVNKTYLFSGGTGQRKVKGLVEHHAYAILEAWEGDDGLRLLKLRNPWGETEWDGDWSDGSKLWTTELLSKTKHTFGDDGIFWMSYKDFLKHFPAIHRARLFDESWYTSQQWTSVNVPWTVDYLDTKFEVTVEKKGPMVFVLSQPDDRYFFSLSGRYMFSLHFRVYRSDDTTMGGQDDNSKYIVRSMYNSGKETEITRSVSAEIGDLEPGKYSVIFKVTARRTEDDTPEQTIRKYAVDKKEKLLQIGRMFDYAQMKGNLRGLERKNRLGKKKEAHDDEKLELKKGRKRAKKERQQSKRKKARIETAKEKAKTEAEAAKKKREDEEKKIEEDKKTEEKKDDGKPEDTSSQVSIPDRTKEKIDEEQQAVTTKEVEPGTVLVTSSQETKESEAESSSKDDKMDETPTTDTKDETSSTEKKDESSTTEKKEETACTCKKDEKTEEFEDDDFDWDSDLDAPIEDSDSDHSEDEGEDPFEKDPWNAMCVVGLRVYTRDVPAGIEVIEDQGDS